MNVLGTVWGLLAVTFYDSQPLLDILGLKARGNAKLGIYQLLDEQTKISGTDEKFLSAVLQKYKKSTGMHWMHADVPLGLFYVARSSFRN